MAFVLSALARLVRLIVGVIVGLIVLAILLRVLSANPSNAIVRDVHDAGRALVGPFKNVFSLSNPKAAIAVNWGLAALIYLLIGGLIVRLLALPALATTPGRRRWYGGRRGPARPASTSGA